MVTFFSEIILGDIKLVENFLVEDTLKILYKNLIKQQKNIVQMLVTRIEASTVFNQSDCIY